MRKSKDSQKIAHAARASSDLAFLRIVGKIIKPRKNDNVAAAGGVVIAADGANMEQAAASEAEAEKESE